MMTLFASPASPFVRKVRVLLLESGLAPQVEVVAASGTALAPGSMPVHANPLGKIPTLVLEGGQALYDSRVICRYLDTLAGGGFYPEARLWQVLTLEALADGLLDAAVLMVYEGRLRPEERQFAPWVEGQWHKVARALDALEADPAGHGLDPALPLDMGQIALACGLGYLDFRHGARDWRAGRPRLAAWAAGLALRPALQATLPQG